MTYQEWLLGLGQYRTENPGQRAGQAAFNYLHQVKPDLANEIQFTTNLDPFHDVLNKDANRIRLKRFFGYVEEHWEEHD
jgi:hypothetical protein